jgi:ribosomal protein S18 acetylase RimI-like enzyme
MVNRALHGDINGLMSPVCNLRLAAPEDVEALLDLMVVSSWGGIRAAWSRVKAPGETWKQRGLSELSDASCEIGYPRFVISEVDGKIAGMVLLNLLSDTSGLDPAREPPEQAGAVALIKLAKHSIFVRELAVVEWARGRGLAQSLLELAESLAESNNLGRMTLIVNDANGPAHRLYLKLGFKAVESCPSLGHPAFDDGSMLVLMEKSVGGRT